MKTREELERRIKELEETNSHLYNEIDDLEYEVESYTHDENYEICELKKYIEKIELFNGRGSVYLIDQDKLDFLKENWENITLDGLESLC